MQLGGRRWKRQRKRPPLALAVALLVLLVPTTTTAEEDISVSQSHRALFGTQNYICALTANIFRFEFDEETGLYVFKQENQNASNFLAVADGEGNTDEDWKWNAPDNDRKLRLLQSMNVTNNSTVPPSPFLDVRVCWCTEYALREYEFCPVEFNTCLVPNPHRVGYDVTSNNTVGCFISQPADTLVRSFWPALVFWCAATLYAMVCSEPGMYARQYIQRCVCPMTTTSDAVVERMLTEQPQRAAGLFRQHLITRFRRRRRHQQWAEWRRRALRSTASNTNNAGTDEGRDALVLRTKVFRTDDSADTELGNDDAEESTRPQCAICLLELEDGERIGDIPCGHLLHKECLKDWLVRKNKCPLCQQAGVARLVVHGDNNNQQTPQHSHRRRIIAAAAASETPARESSEGETSF